MPGIASSPSTDVNGPCSWRKATIFSAVTGPIPGSVSSCSTRRGAERDGRTGRGRAGAGCGRGAGRAARRDDDLLPVGDARRQVDRAAVGATREPARLRDRVGDARAVGEVVEPRFAHRADDVDDDRPRRRPRSGLRPDRRHLQRCRRGAAAVLAQHEHAGHECERERGEQPALGDRERELRHRCSGCPQPCHVWETALCRLCAEESERVQPGATSERCSPSQRQTAPGTSVRAADPAVDPEQRDPIGLAVEHAPARRCQRELDRSALRITRSNRRHRRTGRRLDQANVAAPELPERAVDPGVAVERRVFELLRGDVRLRRTTAARPRARAATGARCARGRRGPRATPRGSAPSAAARNGSPSIADAARLRARADRPPARRPRPPKRRRAAMPAPAPAAARASRARRRRAHRGRGRPAGRGTSRPARARASRAARPRRARARAHRAAAAGRRGRARTREPPDARRGAQREARRRARETPPRAIACEPQPVAARNAGPRVEERRPRRRAAAVLRAERRATAMRCRRAKCARACATRCRRS